VAGGYALKEEMKKSKINRSKINRFAVIGSLRSLQVGLQLAVLLFLVCGQAWAALVVGTSCGLVATAPTGDPEGGLSFTMDYYCRGLKITPSANRTITEIGWYSNQTSEEANFEVAIYSHNAGDDVPDASISKDQTNAKGTGAGWKVVTGLEIELTASTVYWIVIQCDATTTDTYIDGESIVGQRGAYDASEAQLQDPWNQTSAAANIAYAIYALYEGGEPPEIDKPRKNIMSGGILK